MIQTRSEYDEDEFGDLTSGWYFKSEFGNCFEEEEIYPVVGIFYFVPILHSLFS